jgi:formylglycine-generating enzyme required for sulfatase activity
MKIKMVIVDLELSKREKRIVAGALVPVLLLLGGAIAKANVPHTWNKGDTLRAADLNEDFSALDQRLTALEQVDPPCPRGYAQDTSVAGIVLCRSGVDEVVKVGVRGGAFWVDRYEASIWDSPAATGSWFGDIHGGGADYPSSFPRNGQLQPPPVGTVLYAVSKVGTAPSTSMTWFQAQMACRANGKRLPTDEEWLAAASGTPDPGFSDGSGGTCLTGGVNSDAVRKTGAGAACASFWGAQDMIGNLGEWTSGWYAGVGGTTALANQGVSNWPPDYNGDATWNIAGVALTDAAYPGLPAPAIHGGMLQNGTTAGVFAMGLNQAPAAFDLHLGFRCVIPR